MQGNTCPTGCPPRCLRLQQQGCYFFLVFHPLEKRELQNYILTPTSASWWPVKTIFSCSAGQNFPLPSVLPRVLAPRRGPCCRRVSPGEDLLSQGPWLFCIPGIHQSESRNERTEAMSAALGLRSGDPVF